MNKKPSAAISIRQVYDAEAKTPLLFPKAANTILLCELAVAERDPNPADVYRNIRIELSVYRIGGVVIGLGRQYRMTEAFATQNRIPARAAKEEETIPPAGNSAPTTTQTPA